MRIRRNTLLGGVVVAAALLTTTFAGPAAAAPRPGAGGAMHCVSASVPAGSTAKPAPPVCFGTFAAAISHATGGTVRLPAGATRVTQQQLDAGRVGLLDYQQPALVSVVLGVSYEDTGWTGSTWIHTGSYGCDTDPDVDWQNAGPLVGPGGGWDNEIGSASAYSNCTGRYWANSGFWGANIDTGWSGGVMNDASSSIQWY
jgi:hypothetical protein